MKIGLRCGHSPNCKGAFEILDEYEECKKIYEAMVPILESKGHTVTSCNSNANTAFDELTEGTNKANANNCDMFISIHMNASNGAGHGTECWLYDFNNAKMNAIAAKICKNFKNAGFQNRGYKDNPNFHDLNATTMPAMIVETLFCDNQHDVDLYRAIGVSGIARMICEGIDERVANVPRPDVKPVPAPSKPQTVAEELVFSYSVRAGEKVYPIVQNLNDWAGMGDGIPITDIAIKSNFGSVKYRVHVLGGDWLSFVTGYNWGDHNNGYAGVGKPIDAIEVYYKTPTGYANKHGYRKAKYRVSPIVSDGYYSWQFDNEVGNGQDGYAGCFGLGIDKFQLCGAR